MFKNQNIKKAKIDDNMKQHDLFRLFTSSSYDDYKINYLNLFHAKLNDLENRQLKKDFQFYQEIALLLYNGRIEESYIDVRVKYDYNVEFDFLFACKVKSKEYSNEYLVNIELTKKMIQMMAIKLIS